MFAKLLKIALAALVALTTVVVAATIFFVKFTPDLFLSKKVRQVITRSSKIVKLINLNQPGDGLFIYLNSGLPIKVNVYYTSNAQPHGQLGDWVQEMVFQTTGKSVEMNIFPRNTIVTQKNFGDRDLNRLRTMYDNDWSRPILNIVYLTAYREKPGYLGITLHRDTIFIFKNTIEDMSEDESIRARLEQSTLMHEWGHLLGLEHVRTTDCIMSGWIEIYARHTLTDVEVPTHYCQSSFYSLERIK